MTNPSKDSSARDSATTVSQVEQLTTDLKQFVESHTNNVSLFPWGVGKRLDAISNAYGKSGSGQFTQFMENLTDNIGLAKTSGYNYLDRYRQAVALFPEAVINAMLKAKLLPSKQKVIDASRKDQQILDLLKGIRSKQPNEAALWAPGLVQQIKQAAARIMAPKVGMQAAFVKSACSRFVGCLAADDALIISGAVKKPAKPLTAEQLGRQRKDLLQAWLEVLRRCGAVKIVPSEQMAAVQTTFDSLAAFLEDRQV